MPVRIKLEYWEMAMVAGAGVSRQVENCFKGRKPAYGAGSNLDWQINIEGCMGEYVIAKYLNLHWDGKGVFRGRDVDAFEVRTAMGFNRRLILHPPDQDTKVFWSVSGRNGVYDVMGWLLAAEGKVQENWMDPQNTGRWAFFVPHAKLKSPELFDRSKVQVAVYKQPLLNQGR